MDDTILMRPPRDEDVPALVALMNACDEVDLGYPDSDEEEAVWRWRTPGLDRERDALVAVSGAEIVAYAVVHNGHADVWVHPRHRGRGIGTEVLAWIERRSLEQKGPGSELKQFVNERATAARTLLENAGFSPSHHHTRMEIDLPDEIDAPPLPEGVAIRTVDPQRDTRAFYDAYVRAWQQYEGQEWTPEGFETWQAEFVGASDFDPELWLVAEEDGQIVGIIQCFNFPNHMGWVGRVGTLPEQRGRGIATALLLAVFKAYKERGINRIGLSVSSRNVSSARELYLRLGFKDVHRVFDVRKTLQPAEG